MTTNGRPTKVMSSRLAGMKFMQHSGPPSPATPNGPPAKKQRLSSGVAKASPAASARGDATPTASRSAGDQSDAQWYLSFRAPQTPTIESPLRIVSAGYATLDSTTRDVETPEKDGEVSSVRPPMPGRKSFGRFNKVIEKQQNPDMSSSESESEAENEDDDGDDAGTNRSAGDDTAVDVLIAQGRKDATERARAERKAKRKAEKEELVKLAEQRRKKEVNLNRTPTSISNGGGSGGGASTFANMTSHSCGGEGHKQADCPQKRGNGRPTKSRKSY